MRPIKTTAFIMAILSLLLIWVGAPQQGWRTWRISQSPAMTTGNITRVDCQNHGFLTYSFQVAGNGYAGSTPDFHGQCQELREGQRVQIYYASKAPTINYATFDDRRSVSPSSVLRGQLIAAFILFGVVLPMISLATLLLQRKRAIAQRSR